MKKVLLFIWQLPQNILGLLVILFTASKKSSCFWESKKLLNFGVSLGNYIIFGYGPSKTSIQHEQGHQKQSLYLGWLYLLIIGLPSITFNIADILFHKNWKRQDRIKWYYNLPWEHWADKLGNVNRFNAGV